MEVWKEIIGFPKYQVSNLGRVKSFRYLKKQDKVLETIMSPIKSHNGYLRVLLRNPKRKLSFVHRLVLSAFKEKIPKGKEASHLNGIRIDNRVENLSWVTHKENMAHRKFHGTHPIGELNNAAKLTKEDVWEVRRMGRIGFSSKYISKYSKVSDVMISKILRYENWRHV